MAGVYKMTMSKKKIGLGGCATLVLLLIAGVYWVQHLLFDRTPGEYFDSAGTKIYYTTEGKQDGDAVILIHGLAAHSDINWRRPGINDLLDSDFRVVAFDLRGHGLSDHPHEPGRYGIDTVEDITRLMDHLHIEKAHLAGYSLGGFLALKFGILHPERCLSLAICASGWKDPNNLEPLRSPYRDDPETRLPPDEKQHNRLMKGMAELGPQAFEWENRPAQDYVQASILPDSLSNFKGIRDYFGDQVVDREAIKALKKGLGIFAVTGEQLKACQIPTLCIMGTKDGLKPYALDLKQAMPQCELVLIQGADHITTVMYSDFQNTLQKFFLAHRVTSGKAAK